MARISKPGPGAAYVELKGRRDAFYSFCQDAKVEVGIGVMKDWIKSKGAEKLMELTTAPDVTIAHLNSWTDEITQLVHKAKEIKPPKKEGAPMGYGNTEEDEDTNGNKPKVAAPKVKEVAMAFTARVKMTIEVDWGHTMAQGASMLELQQIAMKECAQALQNKLPGVRIIGEIEPVLIIAAMKP